jgi:hypothetical protein
LTPVANSGRIASGGGSGILFHSDSGTGSSLQGTRYICLGPDDPGGTSASISHLESGTTCRT